MASETTETASSVMSAASESRTFAIQALDRCAIVAQAGRCGNDLAVTVCGGSLHHVGAVALAQPEDDPVRQATVSVIAAYGHRDDEVAKRIAKRLAGALHCTVSVSAGIHIDDATASEIAEIVRACDKLADAIASAYQAL